MDDDLSRKPGPPRSITTILTSQSVTYALIYDFLSRRSHTKAAEAVKKAANGSVDLGETSGPTAKLEGVVSGWKGSQPKPAVGQ